MMDVEKQIEYWRQGSTEDWEVAVQLVKDGKYRHGLFFAHLALEKMLKGLICRRTHDVPPKIHNLIRLSELTGLKPDVRQTRTLAAMNQFNLEGRYPEFYASQVSSEKAAEYIAHAQEVLTWLTQQS
ncbi:MAG TPA: HEPN domain-containing protein [Sedimentisphaerales bacterium]|jgi:HEPN domain-containing protein|nr:HEPN domain-containing protein [Sedimentisphaerales bacterium]HNU30314.1 HEPN domain-containing protein [Sedimentisphaerales bacterium]